jgi:hypothetical protein
MVIYLVDQISLVLFGLVLLHEIQLQRMMMSVMDAHCYLIKLTSPVPINKLLRAC